MNFKFSKIFNTPDKKKKIQTEPSDYSIRRGRIKGFDYEVKEPSPLYESSDKKLNMKKTYKVYKKIEEDDSFSQASYAKSEKNPYIKELKKSTG